MRKFLLSLIAVAAVLMPMSQNAQAHVVYYHHYWGGYHYGHYGYGYHRYWHNGYWYGGFWHPAYWAWGPSPVIIVAP